MINTKIYKYINIYFFKKLRYKSINFIWKENQAFEINH